MGLPMEDLHNPTVAGGAASATSGDTDSGDVRALMKQKDNVEAELLALSSVLRSHGVDMDTPLLTRDGFPRADIDVAQIRMTRSRIHRLRNDYKALMASIDKKLEAYFASGGDAGNLAGPDTTAAPADRAQHTAAETPFAKVNSVVANSPAETAGLAAGDLVVKFGDADWLNHEKLGKVAQIVGQSQGRIAADCGQGPAIGDDSPALIDAQE